MRVLLVAFAFPPDPAVGSLRAFKAATALREAGHDVQVLTAGLGREPGSAPPAPWVHEVRPLPGPRQLYVKAKHLLRGQKTEWAFAGSGSSYATPVRVPRWKRYLLSFALLPDDLQGFIPPAVFRARRLIRDGIDVVYTTAPPFSSMLVGWWLKRTSDVRWVAEFRDPWTDSPHKPAVFRSRASEALDRWLERRCLAAADEVIAVTAATQRILQAKRPGRAVHLVRNGVDRLAPSQLPGVAGTIRIVYAGSLDDLRDPRPFLEGLSRFRRDPATNGLQLQVDFYGDCHWFRGRPVADIAREYGVDEVVRVHGLVPHEEIPPILADAHILLVLARGQPLQVPNKVYEYLGAGRPILAFSEHGGETAALLEEHGGHFLVGSNDVAESERALRAAVGSVQDGSFAVRRDILEQWSTRGQMSRLISILEAGDA